MSVLSTPKETLARDIWLPDRSLKASVRSQILRRLAEYIDPNLVHEVLLLGSITGYKYGPESDVDINVTLIEGLERTDYHQVFKKKNAENYVIGANRPLTFFVNRHSNFSQPLNSGSFPYGIYDIIEDEWITPPPTERPRSPQDEFANELQYANLIAKQLMRTLERLHKQAIDYKKLAPRSHELEAKARQIEATLEYLAEQHSTLDKGRKFSYSFNWGVPRKSLENIIYKYIEYAAIGNILDELHAAKLI